VALATRPELADDPAAELQAVLAAGERSLHTEGDLRASRVSFDRAFQLAERAGDAPAMGAAALGLAGLWVGEHRTVTGSVLLQTRLQRAAAQVDEGSPLALRIRVRLAGEADYQCGEHAGILAVLAEARAAGDAVPLAEALSIAHHCLLGPDDLTVRRELAVELIKESFRTQRRSDLLMGLLWQTVDAYVAGDSHAGRLLGELRDQLGQRDHPAVGFIARCIDVMLAIRAGRLNDAELLSGRCAESGGEAGDIDHEWWPAAQLVTVRWYQGRLTELLPMLRERVHSPSLSAVDNSAVAALAVAAALDGDRRTAASGLATLRGSDLARLPRSSSWLVTMNGIVEAACLLDDADLAAEAYDLLRPYAELPMVGGLGITCFGATEQALGVASLTTGRLDQAVEHLQAAVRRNLALAHWPALLSARQRLAQAYRLRGHPGDAEAAEREDAAQRELAATARELPAAGLPGPGLGGSSVSSGVSGRAAPDATYARCARAGRGWRVSLGHRTVLVADSVGMVHLAVLTANPRQDITAADLVAGLAVIGSATADGGSAQPVLDQAAIGEYRRRLRQLDAEIEKLEAGAGQDRADQDRAAQVRADRDWLVGQLASATGLGGRIRSFADDGERARVAAGKAIRRAITRVAEADVVIGEHLRQTVHTGTRCSYWPA
jgi:hypothetical protein